MGTSTGLAAFPDGPKGHAPEIRNAYRFLRGAHRSADGLLVAAANMADLRRSQNAHTKGRPSETEVDLHRSAIVLTSSGIDAAMTRLLWDVKPMLIAHAGSSAHAAYNAYLKEQLAKKGGADSDFRAAVLDADPARALVTHYLQVKARASFQGSRDLKSRIKNTMGVPNHRIPDTRLAGLDSFFVARNEIAHAMDYEQPLNSSTRGRRHRSFEETRRLCDSAFAISADLTHAVADVTAVLK